MLPQMSRQVGRLLSLNPANLSGVERHVETSTGGIRWDSNIHMYTGTKALLTGAL